jgi:hypothetical protein
MLLIPFNLIFVNFYFIDYNFLLYNKIQKFFIISLLGDFTGLILDIFICIVNIVLFVYKISVK